MYSFPKIKQALFLLLLISFLTGCSLSQAPVRKCTILFEDNPDLFFSGQVYDVVRYQDLSVTVGVPAGERIASVSYDDYTISGKTGTSESYDYYTLTLHQVDYPSLIRLTTAQAYTTSYHWGTGQADGSATEAADSDSSPDGKLSCENSTVTVLEESPHLYFNTLAWQEELVREGYVPVGYNTKPDGSGSSVGFGSRFDHTASSHTDWYIQWLPAASAESFTYTKAQGEITITGYRDEGDDSFPLQGQTSRETDSSDCLVIPAALDGFPVTGIANSAFQDICVDTLVLPYSLRFIESGAFDSLKAEHLYLFDNIRQLSEDSFGKYEITHLHINAAREPVYSGSYFDTLSDKLDYLSSLQDKKKIVLFCGSSARFGYDSAMLAAAFPEYHVVNMGVYAYANMLPLSEMILPFMKAGDILLSSPELDAIEMQFCGKSSLDKENFCMVESNYDNFARLDSRQFSNLFGAFADYNASREDMEPKSYLESPSYYDEDGRRQNSPTYNLQGDYILYRENNHDRRLFGVKRAYYNPGYISDQDFEGLNQVYDTLMQKGVTVFFTYSPRSSLSISEDSTPEQISLLDEVLRSRLHAPVISAIESSLMNPLYFYGTDNHLSTEGVRLHTQKIIADLRKALDNP